MQYPAIVRLIDAQLETLFAVRDLLAPSPAAMATPALIEEAEPVTPPAAAEPVKRKRTATAKVRVPRSVRATVKSGLAPRALATAIPAGPVVVSPNALALTRRQNTPPATPLVPKAVVAGAEGTLEALVRDLELRRSQAA